VNNAGVLSLGAIADFPVDEFEKALSVNVRSVFTAVQEALRYMPDGGRIITIGSVNSERMPFQGGSVYALTKGAIASFTKGLARDLGERGITVNNIQPGPVDTEGNPANGPFAETLLGLMAVKRYGDADEIAAMAAYLAGSGSKLYNWSFSSDRRWLFCLTSRYTSARTGASSTSNHPNIASE
jgi:3-oxoacyl-[acyl-carrier protein] reductase